MFAVMGVTGNVGGEVARNLLSGETACPRGCARR